MNGRDHRTYAAFFLALLLTSLVHAQEVEVNSADPDSALQATFDLDVEIGGNGFDHSAEVRFLVTGTEDPGGITVKKVKVKGPKKITATIDVDAEAVVDDFDIEVEVLGGRKGKGTTLFHVKENTSLPNRIAGCVEFAPGFPITTDGGIAPDFDPTYCDGEPFAEDHEGNPGSMQVAMRCQFNHFNVFPGGGSRHLHVDLNAAPIATAISSCEDDTGVVSVEFRDTTMANVPDCTNANDPDWGFFQLMRTVPGEVNVCALGFGESVQANMRFQTHLFYRKDNREPECRGGKNRCGIHREGIEVNYNDPALCPPVTITCLGTDIDGLCSMWIVESSGAGCVSHESGGAAVAVSLPFSVTFTACPDNDCGP